MTVIEYDYVCGGKIFESLSLAIDYANKVCIKHGIILGIERIAL